MTITEELPLTGGGRTAVSRIGDVVHRQTGPWAASVHALLRHFEAVGFAGAPRVIGSGFDAQGRETLSFVPGASPHPGPWPQEAHFPLGQMLRAAHDAAKSFVPPENAVWRDWPGRALGSGEKIIGHCDAGDWNIIADNGLPSAFIDWEQAGPVDPLIDLAQLCWLNAHLFDDDLAQKLNLPDLPQRAKNLRAIAEGYGLAAPARRDLVATIIEFAVHDTAREAIEGAVTPDSTEPAPLWAMAWRARSAAFMLRHRTELQAAMVG